MSASISMPIASSGTSKSAAFVAMPLVTQPASAASSSSGGNGAESTPPSGGGSSLWITKRRVRGMKFCPRAWTGPTLTMALVPRSHVDCTLIVIFPRAGLPFTISERCLTPSRFTSFRCSTIGYSPAPAGPARSEQGADHAGGALRAFTRHVASLGRLPQVVEDGAGQIVDAGPVVLHAHAGAQAVEAARDVEVLLEMIAEREVEKGRAEGGQLHRAGEAALDNGEVGGGVMPKQMRHVGAHVDARPRRQLAWVEPGSRDQQHPCVGDLRGDPGEGEGGLSEEILPHAGAPRGDQDDPLVGAILELMPQRHLVGVRGRVEVIGISGEVEVLPRPLAHVRQVRAELAVQYVLHIAHHDRQVAHVGMQAQVVDVLRVLLPGAAE